MGRLTYQNICIAVSSSQTIKLYERTASIISAVPLAPDDLMLISQILNYKLPHMTRACYIAHADMKATKLSAGSIRLNIQVDTQVSGFA